MIPDTLLTERLLLRPPALDDAQPAYEEYAGDPEVARYLAWRPHAEVGTVAEFLERQADGIRSGNRHFWSICIRPSDRPVGNIGFHIQGHSIGVGYTLGRSHWNRGYMSEALLPLVRAALAEPTVYRVWAYCHVDHAASRRVLEKVGMQLEGVLRRWLVFPNLGPVPCDCACFSAVKPCGGAG